VHLVYGLRLLTVYLLLALGAIQEIRQITAPSETLVVIALTKTEPSESSYCIFMSMRTDGRGGLNSLIAVVKPSPHESNTDGARSVSLPLLGKSLQQANRDTRSTVRARIISRTCLEAFPLFFRLTGFAALSAIICGPVVPSILLGQDSITGSGTPRSVG